MPYRTRAIRLGRRIASLTGRTDVVRVTVRADVVEPLSPAKGSGASVLSSVTQADGFVIVPHDTEGHEAGEVVRVFCYDD
jgi:molybdopterin molybdotransferase